MNRQKLLLAALVLILIGAIAFSVIRSPKQERVAELKNRTGQAATQRRKPLPSATPPAKVAGGLDHALLEREPARFSGYRRNIFSPIFKEEVKLPPVKSIPLPPKLPLPPPPRPVPAAPVAAPPPPAPVDPVAQELARFTFLGFMSKDGAKTVFLSTEKEIFLVKKGSTVAGKFAVTDLTDDALTLSSLSGGREMVIPLVENRSLVPQSSPKRTP